MTTTPNLGLTLPVFNSSPWDVPINNNFVLLDTLIGKILSVPGTWQGVWANSISYAVDDVVVDSVLGTIFKAATAHTSASSGTFAAARIANPSYWTEIFIGNSEAEQRIASGTLSITGATDLTLAGVFADLGYDYRLIVTDFRVTSGDTSAAITMVGLDSAGSPITSGYGYYLNHYLTNSDTRNVARSGSAASIPAIPAAMEDETSASRGAGLEITFHNPAAADGRNGTIFCGWPFTTGLVYGFVEGTWYHQGSTTINGVQFTLPASNNAVLDYLITRRRISA